MHFSQETALHISW